MSVLFFAHLFYSVPSISLYSLMAYVVFRDRKELHGTYYSLLKFGFLIDILSYASNLLGLWLLTFSFLKDWYLSLNSFPWLLDGIVYFNRILLHSQNLRCVVGGLHLVSLMIFPLKAEDIWNRIILPVLFSILLLAAAVASPFLFTEPWLRENDNKVYWEFNQPKLIVIPMSISSFFYLSLTIIPNIITAHILTKHHRDEMTKKISRVTVVCCIVQILNLIVMLLVSFSQQFSWGFSQILEWNVFPFTRDAFCFSAPWSNFFINKDVHRRVFSLVTKAKERIHPMDHENSSQTAKERTTSAKRSLPPVRTPKVSLAGQQNNNRANES